MPPTQLPSHILPAPDVPSGTLRFEHVPSSLSYGPFSAGAGTFIFIFPIVSEAPHEWKGVQTISLSKGRKKSVKLEPQNTYILQLSLI